MKFNNSLVEDNEFVKLIKQSYPAICEKYLDFRDDRLKWEFIKIEIRRITISYTKHKGKLCRNGVTKLQNRFEALGIMLNNSNKEEQLLSTEMTEYDNLKIELQSIYEAKGKGVYFFHFKQKTLIAK